MNKFKILKLMIHEKKYRWRYLYLTAYAAGCRDLPHFLSRRIARSNRKELEQKALLPIFLDTYDGSSQVVHPDMVEVNGVLWLVCTPYPYSIESYENPVVYTGNCIYDLAPVLNKPLAYQEYRKKGNHISDPCIFLEGERISVLFRDTVNQNGNITQKLYLSSTKDGLSWNKKLIMSSTDKSYISPAILKHNEQTIMYYIQLAESTNGGEIHRVCLDDNYLELTDSISSCHNIPDNMVVWHIGITFDDNNSKYISSDSAKQGLTGIFVLRDKIDVHKYALYWAHADDITSDWYIQEEIVIPQYIAENMINVYKSAIIPTTGEILLSYNDKDYRWNLAVLPGKNSNNSFKESYKVFTRVFRKNMTFERFMYKHVANPTLLENYYTQKKEDDKIVGTNCFNGAIGITKEGDDFYIAQSCDTAVIPEARGKGVFSKMITEAEEHLRNERIDVMLGFPNNNSYHGFIKLGWNHIGNFIPWVKVFNPIDVILNKFFGVKKHYKKAIVPNILEKSKKYNITDVKLCMKCPFTEKDFQVINSDLKIKIKRSKEYYRWKCDSNDIFYYYVMRGKDSFSYLIFKITEKGRIIVQDYYFGNGTDEYVRIAIDQFIHDIKGMGNAVVFPMVHESCTEEKVLVKMGFDRGDKKIYGFPVARMIIHRLSDRTINGIEDFSNWYVAALDVDTIIS